MTRRVKGFTLIEVMITLTILGFILLMIFGVFRMSLASWEKGEAIKDDYQKERIISQLISRQIKSLVPYKIKGQKPEGDFLAFEGTAQSLKFVSALPLAARQPEGLVYAVYAFEQKGEKTSVLMLYEQKLLNKNFMDEPLREERGVPLLEGITEVHFEYYREAAPEKGQESGWVEEWNPAEEKALPRALRLTITYPSGRASSESRPLTIQASLPAYLSEELAAVSPTRRIAPPQTPAPPRR